MVILDSIKKSMRIDHTIDDDFIQQLIDTAGEYIKSAIDSSATDKIWIIISNLIWRCHYLLNIGI